MSTAESSIATRQELEIALASLSAEELVKLKRIAELRSFGLAEFGWDDLLQEAIARALTGSRSWPKEIPLVAFLAQTMRSIANESWLGIERADAASSQIADLQSEALDPEREAIAANMLQHVYSVFAADADVMAVLKGMAEGASPDEIQIAGGLTEHQYTAAKKRIRRRIGTGLSMTRKQS